MILGYGSGGWTAPSENAARKSNLPKAQLYDMTSDPGEQNNLYTSNPQLAQELLAQLKEVVDSGVSVAGKVSKNDVEDINLWKSARKKK